MSRYKPEFYEFVGCVVFQDTRYAADQKNPETYLTADEACDLLNELITKLEAAEKKIAALESALESALQYYKDELAIAEQGS